VDEQGACRQPPPEALVAGIRQFNRGEFFACHETLEALWIQEPGPIRDLYQGILQIGVGLYHAERGNYTGATLTLSRGLERVRRFQPACRGVDVAGLVRQAEAVENELRRLGPKRVAELDPRLIPVIRLRGEGVMELNLAAANSIIEASIAEGKTVGRQFGIVVVDQAGNLIAAQRMDGAAILSPLIALGKAFGSAAFRRDGPQLAQMGQNAAFANAVNQLAAGRFVPALGASCLRDGDVVIGAVGVSGAAPEQDQQVAEAGAKTFNAR
jgi:uncharacterized protein GlcG (DUF336 family)